MTFRNYLITDEKKKEVSDHLDGRGCIFFFRAGGTVFGAPEESRLVFAKMKSGDDDMPADWRARAQFAAIDLAQSLLGRTAQSVFGAKNLGDIKLLDRDEVVAQLVKGAK